MVRRLARKFWRDTSGAAMVEMTISAFLMLILLLGFVDFGYLFYQWNAANKAVQAGLRMASVSSPVAIGLAAETATAPTVTSVGDPVPAGIYTYVCTASAGGAPSCTCTGTSCVGAGTASQAAFDLIYFGDDGKCQDPGPNKRRLGMCDFYIGLKPQYVRIEYAATGLGYWTRPGGPVPTIRLSLTGVPAQFFFLSGLMGFANFTMPTMISTATGEDLSTTY